MVLESLTNPIRAEKRPIQMAILGFLYANVAIMLSLWIFYEYSSLVMVFLTVFASVPIVYNTIKLEEKKDEQEDSEIKLLEEHSKALKVFVFLFIGFAVSFALWYVFLSSFSDFLGLPEDVTETLFSTQVETFNSINAQATGMAARFGEFTKILFNNVRVLIFCILFSFIYGLGAIFILAWNASVIGAAIGMYIKKNIAALASTTGFVKVAGYLQIYTIGFLKYSLHGVLEILAYFVGGLAGGIISVAVIRHNFGTRKFERILWDASDLIIISVVILVVAAFVEVWITPVVF